MKVKKKLLANTVVRVILYLWTILTIYPLIWNLYSSFKSNKSFFKSPWSLPKQLLVENYSNAWIDSHFSNYFMNSLIVVIGALFLSVLLSSMTAYGLAKIKFKGNTLILTLFTIIIYVPSIIYLIPLFFFTQSIHLTDSRFGLIIIYTTILGIPLGILMLRSFILGIPNSFAEAARIDGCSELKIYYKIILPMIKPGIATYCTFSVLAFWNEYIIALTCISENRLFTIPIGITAMVTAMEYKTDYGALFAGLMISIIPILVVYLFFQEHIQKSAIQGGVKG